MIVHPDFLDHWKTRMLIDLTADPAAPLMILRLWSYCQIQKKSVFETAPNLRSICRSVIPTEKLVEHLLECGFLRRGDQSELIVHDWEQCNRILRNSWNNGRKGGQHSKNKPTGNPRDSHGHPIGNPPRARGGDLNRIEKVGIPRATHGHDDSDAHNQSTGVVLSEEEKETNRKTFAGGLSKLSEQLKVNP